MFFRCVMYTPLWYLKIKVGMDQVKLGNIGKLMTMKVGIISLLNSIQNEFQRK